MKKITALLWAFCVSAVAVAGVEGGNTELFRPVNAKGELIEIKFGAKHPFQDKLVEMIGRAQLPVVLKSEMLGDMRNTSVMATNEIVTYADTQKQIQMVLSKIVKTTSKDATGGVVETTQEEYTVSEAASKLGLYMIPVNMTVKNLASTYIAAYTQTNPKRVVYFTEFLNQMTEAEAMNLVLHEQAHRLTYLERYRNDERFIEGWAASMLAYLKGEKTKADFYSILIANRLETREVKGIPGEIWYPGGKDGEGVYKGMINVTINADQIVYVGQNKSQYVLQVTNDVFKDYPVFQQEQFMTISVANGMSADLFALVDPYLKKIVEGGLTLSVPLDVAYSVVASPDSNGRYFSTYSQQSATLSPVEAETGVYDDLSVVAAKHNMKAEHVSGQTLGLLNPDFAAQVHALVARVDQAMNLVRRDVPAAYKAVVADGGHSVTLSLNNTYNGSLEVAVSASSGLSITTGMSSKEIVKLTVEVLRDSIVKSATSQSYQAWMAVNPINRLLRRDRILVRPNSQTLEDLKALNDFMVGSTAIQTRLKCIARYEENTELNFDLTSNRNEIVVWNYDKSDKTRLLKPTVWSGWFKEAKPLVERAFVMYVLSGAGNAYNNDKSHSGSIEWSVKTNQLKELEKATSNITVEFENQLRACSGMSERKGD